ncbi:MAG: hypothetical protein RSB77_06235 [Bacilli bacterium]
MIKKGYIGASRSIRSENAINERIMPISLITKDEIEMLLNDFGIENTKISLSKFKEYTKRKATSEWHHTGKCFNKTTHYDLNSIFEEKNDEEIKTVINEINKIEIEKKEKNIDEKYYVIKLESTEWVGNYKKYKKPVKTIYECYKDKNSNWAYSLDNKQKFDIYANKNSVIYYTKKQINNQIKEKLKKNKLKIKNIAYLIENDI